MRANGKPLKPDFETDSRETLLATALCEIRNTLAQHVESQNATDLFGIFGAGWHVCDRLQRPDSRNKVEPVGVHAVVAKAAA